MIATPRIAEVRESTRAARRAGKTVGFVPTMGALHEGHRSLIARAKAETKFVVVSIFVNPTQFGPNEDLSVYPRRLTDDLGVCLSEGVDLVFHPDVDEMYPEPPRTKVSVEGLTETMEGARRAGHFEGVALVCAKLFAIVGECSAFFGEKDAQQLRVVRRMAADLCLPVEVVACPTVRDDDGMALSSRNAYLDPADREKGLALSRALRAVEERARQGERDADRLVAAGREVLESASLDGIDYLEVVDPDTLEGLTKVNGRALVCGAVRVGSTRLIDNVTLEVGRR